MAVAGTVTTTTTDLGAGLFEYSMAWVCDASGAVTENAVAVKRGYIRSVEFIPDGGGTAPSAAYDVTLIDAISVGADFVSAAGANLSATARSIATLYFSPWDRSANKVGPRTVSSSSRPASTRSGEPVLATTLDSTSSVRFAASRSSSECVRKTFASIS